MAAAPTSGLTGTISYASGYTTLCDAWTVALTAAKQPTTGLNPTNSHEVAATSGLLIGGGGTYHCKLAVDANAEATHAYSDFPFRWQLNAIMEPRETTPFGATYRTFASGLVRSNFEVHTWLVDTTSMPLTGTTGSSVLTVTTGVSYTITYATSEVEATVSAEDPDGHILIVRGDACAFPTIAGSAPFPNTTGSATFLTGAGADFGYKGTILITSVAVSVDRRRSEGGVDIGFVFSDTIDNTPAA